MNDPGISVLAERKSFLLRLNPEVHAAMERWARDDLRSLNAQIEFALRLSLEKAGRKLAEPPDLKNEPTSQENGT